MTNSNTPKDGDFAAYVERKVPATPDHVAATTTPVAVPESSQGSALGTQNSKRQTINDVLVDGAEPTDEFLEELNALEGAAPLSDEELARQALEHPGADGKTQTPE